MTPADTTGAPGSRRRRLWELDSHAHCPVIGVCLPIAALRRLMDKALGQLPSTDDYDLHCAAVTDARQRSPLAEALQRDLDRRYLQPLRQAAKAKTTEALATWWDEALRTQHVAGPFWAVLTHARCTGVLERRVLGQVHMLQHQAGMAARVDLNRFEALIDENAVLTRALATAQQRSTRQATGHAQRCEAQQGEIVQLRAQLIARDTAIGHLRDDLQALEATVPGLQGRVELRRENQRQAERLHDLERRALHWQQEAERQQRRAEALEAELAAALQPRGTAPDPAPAAPPARLDAQAVLCVGGRTAAVPVYRQLIEQVGGRFLHHDGGEEDSTARLDVTLAMADLVICQTGCISHDAYWRVKDHCKRNGKKCVYIESPSASSLRRALGALDHAGGDERELRQAAHDGRIA
ncbi:MAG TPA: DUF2325 domain-containing protein [Burkholderiaceae bacterium]|nr:DUF2325 domain-containing protein [Burkholderiaceae bacterium]